VSTTGDYIGIGAAQIDHGDGRLELHFYFDTGLWVFSSKVLLPMSQLVVV